MTTLITAMIKPSMSHVLVGAHKIIGATKHVTLAFFYGIFITKIRKS
jgi:hypothetical protein